VTENRNPKGVGAIMLENREKANKEGKGDEAPFRSPGIGVTKILSNWYSVKTMKKPAEGGREYYFARDSAG